MRQTSTVLYIVVDSLIPPRGKIISGFDEFTAALDHAGVPSVWLSSRSRHQLDEPRRRLGHAHPFIAEDGCGIYLPEDYFHLRPASPASHTRQAVTVRLGRFTCVPVAERLPAASLALETLSAATQVPIVTLRSLSLRELVQNTGFPQREAQVFRQRDFEELFFFAGASEQEIRRFLSEGRTRGVDFRQRGVLWSAAIGASTKRCITELSKLYDRALRCHIHSVGVATPDLASGVFPSCSRCILLADRGSEGSTNAAATPLPTRQIPLHAAGVWNILLEIIAGKPR